MYMYQEHQQSNHILSPHHSISQRGVWVSFGHPVSILDTLFYLSFTCTSIVSEQFGHPVLKFPANVDAIFLKAG